MKNLKTHGFILIDVDVVALNNAGKSETTKTDNGVATKKIRKNGRTYTYVSGQAWRSWWRNTLEKQFDWRISPITRAKKIAFTEANPIKFADDDIFGYMKATKDNAVDENDEDISNKVKKKEEDKTVTRISPLKNSAIISVTSVQTVENFSVMSRQEGDPVPYTKEEYSAIMKGMFSLDLEMTGTFATYNKTGFKNLSTKLREEALKNGADEIEDTHLKDVKGVPHKLVRLSKETRLKRISDTIKALKYISGGAMQTSNLADVAPKFIILATTTSGNHPFSNMAIATGNYDDQFKINYAGLAETLKDNKDQIKGNVYIGVKSGFLSDFEMDELKTNLDKFKDLVSLQSINEAIDKYTENLNTSLE